MSDLSKFYGSSRFTRAAEDPFKYLKPQGGGLSKAEVELLPHLKTELDKQDEQKSMWNPLDLVFDLLNRGQYLTANLGQDIAEGKDIGNILTGAWRGVTGERKGSWQTTLFGGKDVGEEQEGAGIIGKQEALQGKIPFLSDIPILGDALFKSWEDVIGLAANILLDPTTYFTFGAKQGATTANKAAARAAAKEAVKRSILSAGNLDELAKITSKGFNKETLKVLMGQSLKKADEYVKKHVSAKAMATFNKKIFNDTYKQALSMTGKEFTGKMLEGMVSGGDEFAEQAAKRLAGDGADYAVGRIKDLVRKNPGSHDYLLHLKDLASNPDVTADQLKQIYKNVLEYTSEANLKGGGKILNSAIEQYTQYAGEASRMSAPGFAQNFEKLGERKVADFFGKEIGKGVRQPNIWARGTEAIKSKISQSKVGDFGRALSSWLDNGKVGAIRSALNLRNPYQEMLNADKMANHYYTERLIGEGAARVEDIFGKVDEKTLAKVTSIIDYGKTRGISDLQELMNDPGALKMLDPGEVEKVRNLILTERHLVDDVFLKEADAASRGFLAEYTPMANYLPHHDQVMANRRVTKELGPYKPGYMKPQELDLAYIGKQDAAVIQHFLGLDEETAKRVVTELNWSTTNMNLKEMLMYRMHAHARAMATADLAEKFAQFGVKPDLLTANPQVLGGLGRAGENAFAGLRQIQTEIPALKGMFFDEEVANILDKVIPIVSSDRGLRGWEKMLGAVTTNFKAWALATPGFNLRNDRSNTLTGFINYGVGFLNPARKRKAALMSAYGLYGEQAVRNPSGPVGKFLKTALGFNDYSINKIFDENISGKTAKEWADQVMTRNGIISKASMGYDLPTAIGKMGKPQTAWEKFSPISNENIIFRKNQEVMAIIESTSKAQGFFMDIERMAGKGGQATEGMVAEAVKNVKKFFFDYEDLSEFEQRVMKKVIPFYCVDETTEALTNNGWKNYSRLDENEDKLFTVNLETQKIELQKCEGKAEFDYSGEMIHIKNRNTDMLLTPNHRCIYQRRGDSSGRNWNLLGWRIKEAQYLNITDWLPIATKGWSENKKRYDDSFVELIGWIITEGTIYPDRIIITQKNRVREIDNCLSLLNLEHTKYPKDKNSGCFTYYIPHGKTKEIRKIIQDKTKTLPLDFILKLTKRQMNILIDTMVMGDGYKNWKEHVFLQKNDVTAEVFQILCTLAGYNAKIHKITKFSKNRFSQKPLNRVRIKSVKHVNPRGCKREPYAGKVWCPSTQNGTVFFRRNGQVFPSGQTWLRKNIALQITQLTDRTGAMATVAKISKAAQAEGVEQEDLPDYVRQQGGIATGIEEGIAKIFFPDLPYKDINLIPFKFDMNEAGIPIPHVQWEEAYNDFLSAAHPLFKTVLATAGEGWDPFQRRQLDSKAPAPRVFRLLGDNPGVFAFLDSAARAIGIKGGLGLEVDKDGKIEMDGKIAKIMEDNFLVIKRLDDLGDSLLTVFPDIDKALEEATGIKSRYEGMEKVFHTMSFALGLSRRDIDLDKQEEYAFRDALKRAETARSEERGRAPGAQVRSDQYYRNYQNRMRTLRAAVR